MPELNLLTATRESSKRLVCPERSQSDEKMIDGLIGPTLVASAASMLLNIGSFPELAEQVSRDPALIFVSGILLFVACVSTIAGRMDGRC